jgi:SAM-dependent methyltransferase
VGSYVTQRPGDIHRATPAHRYRHHVRTLPRRLAALARELRVPEGGRVLDYGCAEQPYRGWFAPGVEYVGADLPGNPLASVEIAPDGTVAVPDASFDAVLSTQVLEHVADPAAHLRECARVLKPGGRLLLSTHGVFVYHPDPDDYWRWTCAGLRLEARRAGLEVERFEGIVGLAATGLQLLQDALFYSARVPRPVKPALAFAMQRLVALADRLTTQASRDLNAQVFALVARKP